MTDLVLVPRHATKAMRRAATDAMRRFHEANPDAGWVSSGVKAGLRWEAMVEVGMNGQEQSMDKSIKAELVTPGIAASVADRARMMARSVSNSAEDLTSAAGNLIRAAETIVERRKEAWACVELLREAGVPGSAAVAQDISFPLDFAATLVSAALDRLAKELPDTSLPVPTAAAAPAGSIA